MKNEDVIKKYIQNQGEERLFINHSTKINFYYLLSNEIPRGYALG